MHQIHCVSVTHVQRCVNYMLNFGSGSVGGLRDDRPAAALAGVGEADRRVGGLRDDRPAAALAGVREDDRLVGGLRDDRPAAALAGFREDDRLVGGLRDDRPAAALAGFREDDRRVGGLEALVHLHSLQRFHACAAQVHHSCSSWLPCMLCVPHLTWLSHDLLPSDLPLQSESESHSPVRLKHLCICIVHTPVSVQLSMLSHLCCASSLQL